MQVSIRKYVPADCRAAIGIWNEVVREGAAFPQMEELTMATGDSFFTGQSFTGVAFDADTETMIGLYILHPNNVGRCGHLCNASYAVRSDMRGRHVGEELVRHCMLEAKELGYRILQFNAVVAGNIPALKLYRKLGFVRLGVIPGGFMNRDGAYEDIIPHYIVL